MISQQDYGRTIRYWKNGWHAGILLRIEGSTAVVEHPVLKRQQKVAVVNCEVYIGEIKMTIFDHLFKAAQTLGFEPQAPGQLDKDFMTALLKTITKLPLDTWNSLPIPAQQWFNEAAGAFSALKPIPPCPGFVSIAEAKGLTAAQVLNTPQSERVQSVKPNIANIPKQKRTTTGVMDALRKTVILNPDWNTRQVYQYLRDNGFPNAKLDTISVDGGNIRRVIEIARELGFWKDQKDQKGQDDSKEILKQA